MVVFRGADQKRRIPGPRLGQLNKICIGGHRRERQERDFRRVGDAVGRAEARFGILIGELQAVRHGVVMAHVHRRGLGRPEPKPDLPFLGCRAPDLERSRVLLPEILHDRGHPAAQVPEEYEPGGAVAVQHMQPRALLVRSLFDRESVRVQLGESEVVPIRRGSDVLLSLGRKLCKRRDAFARELVGKDIAALRKSDLPPACERLDRLGPHSGVACEPHVPVLDLVAQGHVELQADPPHEVLLFVGIVDDRMDHADRGLTGVKVKADDERQHRAPAFRGDVRALELDRCAHRTALLERHLVDAADEFVGVDRAGVLSLHLVGDQEHEAAIFSDLGVPGRNRFEDHRSVVLQDAAAHGPRVDIDECAGRVPRDAIARGALARLVSVLHRCVRGPGCAQADLKRPRQPGRGADGVAGPLERTVRPIGQRPGLQAQLLAIGAF